MFGLFKKTSKKPTVTTEDKDWIEKNFIWFIETFGLDHLNSSPFILPTVENFPYDNYNDSDQFSKLFQQLCKYWQIDPDTIEVKFFDDFKSKTWSTWSPQGAFSEVSGLYSQTYTLDKRRFSIQIAKSNLANPQLLVSVISHELAHVKLLGEQYVNRNDPDMEALTDLAAIFFGFGIFVANSCFQNNINWIGRSGYLPNEIVSYSNALLCLMKQRQPEDFIDFLNFNTKAIFQRDHEFLKETNDTLLSTVQIANSLKTYQTFKRMNEFWDKRDFEKVIEIERAILSDNPKDKRAHNSLGYALLQQKKYEEAIDFFTKSVEIDPYWEYPYNNRGYCHLQIGNLEDALTDIQTSFDLNSENSYVWRNLGACYFKTGDYKKALEHFEQAQKMDPSTEMINFYLAIVENSLKLTP